MQMEGLLILLLKRYYMGELKVINNRYQNAKDLNLADGMVVIKEKNYIYKMMAKCI